MLLIELENDLLDFSEMNDPVMDKVKVTVLLRLFTGSFRFILLLSDGTNVDYD